MIRKLEDDRAPSEDSVTAQLKLEAVL
jgi:hypothetical protein